MPRGPPQRDHPALDRAGGDLLTADERLTPNRIAGVASGFGGVVAIVGPAALSGLGLDGPAQLRILAAAISYALAAISGRRLARLNVRPTATATAPGQVTASTILLLRFALLVDRPWTSSAWR